MTANCRALVRPGTRQGTYPATETPAGTVANAVDALCRPKLRASTPAATGEVSRPDAADVPGAGKGARPTPKEEDELLPETKSRRPLADGAPLRERPRRRLGNDDPWMPCRRWATSARSKARKRPGVQPETRSAHPLPVHSHSAKNHQCNHGRTVESSARVNLIAGCTPHAFFARTVAGSTSPSRMNALWASEASSSIR